MHTTDVNEKDRIAAIDEKQHVSLDVDTNLAKYKISIRSSGGQLSGKFKVRLGEKESRDISADASQREFAAALTELFSNCASNLPYDYEARLGGTHCAKGPGLEVRPARMSCLLTSLYEEMSSANVSIICIFWQYRGLKDTSIDGETCLDWKTVFDNLPKDALVWDPWLALVSGLDKNLCRNPDGVDSSEPFCYVQVGPQ